MPNIHGNSVKLVVHIPIEKYMLMDIKRPAEMSRSAYYAGLMMQSAGVR